MTQGIALVLQVLIFLKGAGSSSTTITVSPSEHRTSSSLSMTSSSRTHTSGIDQASSRPASASSSESVSVTSRPILAAIDTPLVSSRPASASSSESVSVRSSPISTASYTASASSSASPSTSVQGAISTATATGQSMTVSTPSLDSATSSTLQPSSSSIFLPSSNPSTAEGLVNPVFVRISFSMLWSRFCSLTSLFTESLSQVLITVKDGRWQHLSTGKIKLMNRDEKCDNRSHFDQEAVLKFYISYSEKCYGQNDTDNKRTEEAYKILDSYWKGDTIVLLDQLFADKVTKVERCVGLADEHKAKCTVTDKYTEAERVGIGIGVGFAVIVLVLVVIKLIKRCQTTDNGRVKPGDTNRVVIVHEENRLQGSSTSITNQDHPSAELEEIEIHKLPPDTKEPVAVVKGQDEMPLLSAVSDFQEGQKVDGNKPDEETTEGVPGEDPAEKTSDDPTNLDAETPSNSEEEGTGERRPTFTSSMTIAVTPDAKSTPTEYEFPAQDDDDAKSSPGATKPDLSQLQSSDDDPNQGFINHAFESQTDKPDLDEETKF
ncbi:uncharacterized protein LOC114959568 isoform X2 [Acropora millepora]|nr:uncharacterized protein LOC114959568 isoform X2 [Acropora millepora]